MKNLLSYKNANKIIISIIAVMIFLTAVIIPFIFMHGNKGGKISDNISFYARESEKAVFLAGSYSSNIKEMSALTNLFLKNNVNVITAKYDDGYKSYEEAIEFLENKGFEKQNTVVIGYDMGGFFLVNHLSKVDEGYASAVLLSPYYKDFDERSIPVNDTSYVNNIDWLKKIEPLSYKQPTTIITTTLDDIASPSLVTVIYNHMSGDDILLSANRYGASRGNIDFNVLSGVNHLYVPYSVGVMESVCDFLNQSIGWQISGISGMPFMMLLAWIILPFVLLGGLIFLYLKVRYKFYTVSYSIDSYEQSKSGIVIGWRLLGTILAIPISYGIYILLGNLQFYNESQRIMLAYMLSVSCVMYVIYRTTKSAKNTGIFGEVNLNPGFKRLFISVGVSLAVIVLLVLQSLSGFIFNVSYPNIVTSIISFVILLVSFYVTSTETEMLRRTKLSLSSNITYYIIKIAPYVIVLIWNMFISRHTIALVYFRNIMTLSLVLAMGRVIMEICGQRKLTSFLMAIAYISSFMLFEVTIL